MRRVCSLKITCVFLVVLITTITSGCSASLQALKNPVPDTGKVTSELMKDMEYLAAIDLVNTLVQVPRLHPANATVLQMKRPTPGFGQNVYEVMKIAGYNIQVIDTDNVQEPRVSYSRTPGPNKSTFQINIETFRARRAYSVVDNKVQPDSSMFIYGADPNLIETNDLIFEKYESVSGSVNPEKTQSL